MEDEPNKVLPESSDDRGSGEVNPNDIRNLWTTAALSEPELNMPLSEVCENFDEETSRADKSRWYSQNGHWEDDEEDKGTSKPESPDEEAWVEVELDQVSTTEPQVRKTQESEDSKTQAEKSSSMLSVQTTRHTPHQAYWAEQQNRLPLPLIELMENEALEILTKALRSYRSRIGKQHFLTKELQRYIEGIKKRQNLRQNVTIN
ncbi:cation channel sperm-associated protein subunit zeta [Otolemur garnettii]|uniref:cation channel sperm-associated protein subunit zeta n=1 Tax=Otolemur garnettii TaxID=30611 RepID=UPI00064467D3|nr:cation channel sperm-associated protein subunit zeta [Otolemur garnettii]